MRYQAREPLSFAYTHVVDELRRQGFYGYAELVQRLGRKNLDVKAVEDEWRQKYLALQERLHVYEPPACSGGRSNRAPAESDG
jgi:hypothetical protein